MIGVTELRSGAFFEENGEVFQVLSYEHIKMGRGTANIKLKVKNLKSGAIHMKSFISGARVKPITIIKKDLQFLYKDSSSAYFMDNSTFEQTEIPLRIILHESDYLKEGETFNISFLGNDAVGVNLPPKMIFEVAETGPSVKGNTASNVYKDAVLSNGIKTRVPLFINTGDKIKVDTRDASYTERAQ